MLINVIDTTEKELLKDKIERDNERRRGIMMTVAHELRTPLQPILGYLNLLIEDPKDAGLTEGTQKILERCRASADRERQIINRMIDLSVLDSGKFQISCTSFFMAELIQTVIDTNGYIRSGGYYGEYSRGNQRCGGYEPDFCRCGFHPLQCYTIFQPAAYHYYHLPLI